MNLLLGLAHKGALSIQLWIVVISLCEDCGECLGAGAPVLDDLERQRRDCSNSDRANRVTPHHISPYATHLESHRAGIMNPFIRAASRRMSPPRAKDSSLLTMKRWILRTSLHLESDRPDMPRVPDLGAIECGDPQVNSAGNRDVILTFRIEAARNLDRPPPCRPARCATD